MAASAEGTRPRRRRLSAEARRAHLLDTAAEIVLARGFDALTMESVGAAAGTSKTLGYAYFANVDDLVLSLYDRELAELFHRVEQATERADAFDGKLAAAVGAYFDVVAERGILIGLLQAGIGSRRLRAGRSAPTGAFLRWLAELIRAEYGCDRRRARHYAGVAATVADLQARSWHAGRLARRQVEADTVGFVLAGLERVLRRATSVPRHGGPS